jgi:hypothetical protein
VVAETVGMGWPTTKIASQRVVSVSRSYGNSTVHNVRAVRGGLVHKGNHPWRRHSPPTFGLRVLDAFR